MVGDLALEVWSSTSHLSSSVRRRADDVLASLIRVMDVDAAWVCVSDPRLRMRPVVVSHGLGEVDLGSQDRSAASVDPIEWVGRSTPSGLRMRPSVVLRDPGGSPVGSVGLLCRDGRMAPADAERWLVRQAPAVARVLSPMGSLLASVRMAPAATAGVALLEEGGTAVLPGLRDHELLRASSSAMDVAARSLRHGQPYRSFFWPVAEDGRGGGHARLTVVAAPELPGLVRGTVLLTPDADSRGLTPRELQVLGLLVNGRSNQEIARRLAVAPGTVATHVEHVMRKLGAPSRTQAAVRAERDGCYVPPSREGGVSPRR